MDRAKLLVADDDDVTLTMLDAALSAHHDVVAVTGGQAALVAAQKDPFDLVLLDVDMPDLDGYAACQALKAQAATADVPVLFLSARVNLDERLKGYRVGASDYLTKPFEVAELHAKIALAVEQRARQRALSGQLDEAMNAVMSMADMYGEVGVVLNFQRRLAECRHYRALAEVFFDTWARWASMAACGWSVARGCGPARRAPSAARWNTRCWITLSRPRGPASRPWGTTTPATTMAAW